MNMPCMLNINQKVYLERTLGILQVLNDLNLQEEMKVRVGHLRGKKKKRENRKIYSIYSASGCADKISTVNLTF